MLIANLVVKLIFWTGSKFSLHVTWLNTSWHSSK